MRLLPRVACLWLLVVVAGCPVGTTSGRFRPAQGPAGVDAQLVLDRQRGTVAGELLAMRDTGFVLLVGNRVTLVRYGAIRSATFPQVASASLGRQPPTPAMRERLRLVSRFPQGISPELEQRLLAGYSQPTIDVIEP